MCGDHDLQVIDKEKLQELINKSPKIKHLLSTVFIQAETARPVTLEDILKLEDSLNTEPYSTNYYNGS